MNINKNHQTIQMRPRNIFGAQVGSRTLPLHYQVTLLDLLWSNRSPYGWIFGDPLEAKIIPESNLSAYVTTWTLQNCSFGGISDKSIQIERNIDTKIDEFR